jgi:hypothetical protein
MSRACSSATNTSERLPTHFTGRPSVFAARQRAVFRVGVEAHAEAAAHFLGDDAHLLRRHPQHRANLQAHRSRALRGGVQRVLVCTGVVAGGRRARLHRIADHARVVGRMRHHLRRARERGLGFFLVAAYEVEHEIAWHRLVQLRRAGGERCLRREHGGQLLVIHEHRLRRVLRLRRGLGNHQGNGFAYVPHAVGRERIARRHFLIRAAAALHGGGGGHGLVAGGKDVLARQHLDHAGHGERGRGVDRHDARVRTIRAQKMARASPRSSSPTRSARCR